MGKQINFYMNDSTQNRFFDFVRENQFIFLSYYGETIDNINEYYDFYLYKREFGDLSFKDYDKSLDTLNSPVIEVIKSRIKGQKVLRGRIWVSDIFYKKNIDNLEYCKKYMDAYQILYKWIKKNVPYQEVMMGGYAIKEYADDVFTDIENKGFVFSS